MIYFVIAFIVSIGFGVCAGFIAHLMHKVSYLEKVCEKNIEFISRHAAEHVRMAEEQDEVAGKIAEQIEKRWDEGLSKMLVWNPFTDKESDGG